MWIRGYSVVTGKVAFPDDERKSERKREKNVWKKSNI